MALGGNISPGQGETYYQKDDYYLTREGGNEHKLEWSGELSKELGLEGKVKSDDWKKALNGELPGGIKINGGTFKGKDGEIQRRAGTDFVIEAPKTVSMLYGDTHREDIKQAILDHQAKVVQATRDFYEEKIGVRERKGAGIREFQETSKGLFGTVGHFSTRDGDIFLHNHLIALNVTKKEDGTYVASTNDRMFAYQGEAKELAESMWAKWMVDHGLAIDKGRYGEVQINGYTREQIEFSSKRAAEIERYIQNKWGVDWKSITPDERRENQHMHDEAQKMTKKAKTVKEIGSLEEKHQEVMKESGGHDVTVAIEKTFSKDSAKYLSPEKRLEIARESLKFAIDHHTERESAVKEGDLIRTALKDGRGTITLEDMEKAMEEMKAEGSLIRQTDDLAGAKQNLVTSKEALEREKRILSYEKSGRGAVIPVMNPLQAENALKAIEERDGLILNNEQKAAGMMMLTTDNRYSGINGYAGTGKTTMLKPAIEVLQNAGYRVIGLGPQHSAVHALKDAGIIESRTLQSWLADRQAGKNLDEKTVVIIDEAGLANAKDLDSAMKRIEKAGARSHCIGDRKQFENVAAGPAFAILQDNGMETVTVTKMQRQKNAPENIREAARLSVDSPAKALEKLEIREIRNPQERFKALSEAYLKSKDPTETLVLTGTHDARKAVNNHVRESLGLKGKGEEFTRYEAGDSTEAQKKRIDAYEVGQDVRFGKDYRSMNVKSGEIGKIASVDKGNGTVHLKMQDGRDVTLTPREMSGKGHEIGQLEKIELSQGDRIRVTGNELKKEGITNGMKGAVLESKHDSLSIRLDSGKTFDLKPGDRPVEIDHGYAQTGHSAQGLGAQTVILDLPSNSRTLNERSFYTNLTRTKDQVVAFTDDREKLTGAVSRENDKSMAHDVEKNQNVDLRMEKLTEKLMDKNTSLGEKMAIMSEIAKHESDKKAEKTEALEKEIAKEVRQSDEHAMSQTETTRRANG